MRVSGPHNRVSGRRFQIRMVPNMPLIRFQICFMLIIDFIMKRPHSVTRLVRESGRGQTISTSTMDMNTGGYLCRLLVAACSGKSGMC